MTRGRPSDGEETNLGEAEHQLEIQDEDLKAIRESKDPNWLVRGLVTVAVTVITFVMGVIIGNASETGNSNYPYGAMLLAANASARRKRIPFLFILLLAILSFFSFSLGLATTSGPSFGVVIYYGSYSPKT